MTPYVLLYYFRWDNNCGWIRLLLLSCCWNRGFDGRNVKRLLDSAQTDTNLLISNPCLLDRRCIAYLNSQKTRCNDILCDTEPNVCIYGGQKPVIQKLFVLLRIKFWTIPGVLCRSVRCSLSNVFTREFRAMFSILESGSVGLLWSDDRQR